jgi:hypothetical protein
MEKVVKLKIREFETQPSYELWASNYPGSGVFINKVTAFAYVVSQKANVVYSMPLDVFHDAIEFEEKPTAPEHVASGISATDLIKLVAVTAHRDAAVAALAA